MALKAIITKLDDVPEGLRTLYVKNPENEKQFLLDVEGIDGYELKPVAKLMTALSTEREARGEWEAKAKSAETKLEAFKTLGDKPEKVAEKLAKYDELVKIDPKKEADRLATERVALWSQEEGTKFQQQIAERDTKVTGLEAALDVAIIDSAVMSALIEHKGNVQLLTPHVRAQLRRKEVDGKQTVQVVQRVNGQEVPRIGDANGGAMTVSQLVAEMKKDQAFAPAFAGTGASGSGAPGSNGSPNNRPGAGGDAPKKGVDRIRAGLQSMQAGQ